MSRQMSPIWILNILYNTDDGGHDTQSILLAIRQYHVIYTVLHKRYSVMRFIQV